MVSLQWAHFRGFFVMIGAKNHFLSTNVFIDRLFMDTEKEKKEKSKARTKKSSNYFGVLVALVVIKILFFDGDFKLFSEKVSKYDSGSGKKIFKAISETSSNVKDVVNETRKIAENSFSGVKYMKNYDGDTITFSNVGNGPSIISESMSVRVAGIDTPEIKGKNKCEKNSALVAKKLVEKILTAADRIDLIGCKKGKYFRLVCSVVAIKGKYSLDLADVLKKEALAYPYDGGTKQTIDWCNTKK